MSAPQEAFMVHAFEALTPERVLDALGPLGLEPDGRIQSLSSYENRVYAIGLEGELKRCVVKFYRPMRWQRAQILEEHAFALSLQAHEVPIVAPLQWHGQTLHHTQDFVAQTTEGTQTGFAFCVYPYQGGRPPELDDVEVLEWLGRYLARIHQVGELTRFEHRQTLDVHTMGEVPRAWILQGDWMQGDRLARWGEVSQAAIQGAQTLFDQIQAPTLRIHGDCHAGNVLWRPLDDQGEGGAHFVDLDDARMGVAVQDLWMLMGASGMASTVAQEALLCGYEQVRAFDRRQLRLVEALRTLRMIHYSAWLAQRVGDPAFATHFAWFGSESYWDEQIHQLQEQIGLMQEAAQSGMGFD